MAKVLIRGTEIDYTTDGWSEFKKWIDGTYSSLRYAWVDDSLSYQVVAPDGAVIRTCSFNKGTLDSLDFEDGWDTKDTLLEVNRDGRQIVQPVTVNKGQWHYWHSIGDSSTTLRAGTSFKATRSTTGNEVVTWQYRDPVWMAGGSLQYSGAEFGDWVSLCIYAPATTVVPNVSNTGNCNVYGGVIVPAPNDGAYDVDLNDTHPVPSPTNNGYWDYAFPVDYKLSGVVSPSGTPGSAKYHLLAVRQDLTNFVAQELMMGTRDVSYEPQNINASLCLPEWRFECTVHNESGGHSLYVTWRVLVSRYWTTQ